MPDPFLTILQSHEPALRALVAMLVREPRERDDAWQEVTVELWRSFPRYDAARPFAPWARTVAARQLFKFLRRLRRESAFPADTLELTGALMDQREAQSDDRREALQRCMESLPAGARRLLSLRYADELSCPRIADATGQSPEAVHKALSRIRARLGDCIRQRLSTPELASTPAASFSTLATSAP